MNAESGATFKVLHNSSGILRRWMGWESRGNREYYYSARREGGRVVKRYFGTSEVADLAAKMHAIERVKREMEREAFRGVVEDLADLDEPLDTFADLTDLLARAALLAAGYYYGT